MLDIPNLPIEHNVPIPLPYSRCDKRRRWNLAALEVGDSYFLPSSLARFEDVARSLQTVASSYGKRNKKMFTQRRLPDGVRLWRIK